MSPSYADSPTNPATDQTAAQRLTGPGGHRSAGLDLLRGIAVALVIAHHAGPEVLPGTGWVGVVMFFALSGYLITGVLLERHIGATRRSLGSFYLRRARRLVPGLLLLVGGIVAVTLLVDPLGDRGELGWTVLFALTWTGDLPFGHASAATFHLWTLALEEQFYLAWPPLLLVCATRARPRLAAWLAGGACALGTIATTCWLAEAPDLAYSLPTSWAGCFVIGAAFRLRRERGPLPTGPRRTAVAVAALLVVVAVGVLPLRGHAWTYLVAGPAIAVLTSLAVRGLEPVRFAGAGQLWARPIIALGTISYSAYLWNYPLVLWLRPAGAWGVAAATGLTLVIAAASWRYVERPLLTPRPWQPLTQPVTEPPLASGTDQSQACGGMAS